MSNLYTREEIIKFLEKCVHKIITLNNDPDKFKIITNTLYNRYLNTNKFNKEVLDEIEAFKVTRSNKKKSLILQLKFKNSKCFKSISWTKLYKNEFNNDTHISKVTKALRHHIKYQIQEYRHNIYNPKCILCNESNQLLLEVDHKPPNTFKNIKSLFFLSFEVEKIKVYWNGNNYILSNNDIAIEWEDFHKKLSEFRILCSKCNKIKIK